MFTSLWMDIPPQTVVLLKLSGRCQDHHLLPQDAPLALPRSTSLILAPYPAWTALLATSPLALTAPKSLVSIAWVPWAVSLDPILLDLGHSHVVE